MAVSRKAMTEGIRTFLFPGTPCECKFDNPSVKNQRFLPAVHCGMTATGSHGNFDSLRGAPPFTQGSLCASPGSVLTLRGHPAPLNHGFAKATCFADFFDTLKAPLPYEGEPLPSSVSRLRETREPPSPVGKALCALPAAQVDAGICPY